MNILYCVPALYNPGGMERILTEKVNFLANIEGYQIHILTTDQDHRAVYFDLDSKIIVKHLNLDFNQFFTSPLVKKIVKTNDLIIKYKGELEQYIHKNAIDIVVSLGGKELEFLYKINNDRCKKICELHFSIKIREQFILARGNNIINRAIGKIRTQQLIKQTKKLDRLIVLTKEDEKELRKTHQNVKQIYNFSPLTPDTKSDLTNKKMLAIGKLDPQKGFDLLIEACSKIIDWKGWTLSIYGQGSDKDKLQSLIESYQLNNYIVLEGITKNVQEVYNESSMFILSSRYEGFPMVLIEAISYGLPIISFDCMTGPREIIENNDCGILVENGNIHKLSEAINEMIENSSLRHQMSETSFYKSGLFLKHKIMQQWVILFNDL